MTLTCEASRPSHDTARVERPTLRPLDRSKVPSIRYGRRCPGRRRKDHCWGTHHFEGAGQTMNRSSDILVGIDGSAESKFAIAWALAEARARNCGLILVHACEAHDYGLWTTTKGLRAGLREMARPIIDEGLALAAKIDPKIPARGGVLVGSPNRILVRLSSLVSLVVIGRNGRGALSRLLLGSVTQYLAANAGCPVVAVGRPPRGIDTATVDRVVAAIASASINVQTLRFAFAEAAHRNSPLEVVHAVREADEPASS